MKKKIFFNILGFIFLLIFISSIIFKFVPLTGAVIDVLESKRYVYLTPLIFLVLSFLMFSLAKKVSTHYYLQGAKEATGSAVIIDTYRGSSLISTVLGLGAEAIYPITNPKEARKKAKELSGHGYKVVLMGEKDQKTPKDFDFGNSLEDALKYKDRFQGAMVVYVSTNAVAGIDLARKSGKAKEVLIGSPVNRKSLVHYLQGTEEVSLVAMGEARQPGGKAEYSEEDMEYAHYLKELLDGKDPQYEPVRDKILGGRIAKLAPKYNAEFDRDYALKLDQWNVVPRVEGDKIIDALKGKKLGK